MGNPKIIDELAAPERHAVRSMIFTDKAPRFGAPPPLSVPRFAKLG